MRTTAKRALVIGALTVGLAVPAGAAIAASDTASPDPTPGTTGQDFRYGNGRGPGGGPPKWAPEECREHYNSPEMQRFREEHQEEMQELREEHRQEMQERFGDMWRGGRG